MSGAEAASGRRLDGRVVWITGASRGIGRALARGLADRGATIALSARTEADLTALAATMPLGTCSVHPLSVADPEAVETTVRDVLDTHGRLDGLVNCAGISPSFRPALETSMEDWRSVLDVNLTGTFLCARAAGRYFVSVGAGSVVNVSSIHASHALERLTAYAASKGGVEALTRVLAVEWAGAGVRVNVLAPGYFDSDLSRGLLSSRWGDRIRARTPMARTGEADELVGAAAFLLSEESSFVTGSTLTVDGGWSAW